MGHGSNWVLGRVEFNNRSLSINKRMKKFETFVDYAPRHRTSLPQRLALSFRRTEWKKVADVVLGAVALAIPVLFLLTLGFVVGLFVGADTVNY